MAYIGKGPEQVLSGVASKSTFTGDGSTTDFTMSSSPASVHLLAVKKSGKKAVYVHL